MSNELIETFKVKDIDKPLTADEEKEVFDYFTKHMHIEIGRSWSGMTHIELKMLSTEITQKCVDPFYNSFTCGGSSTYVVADTKMRDLLIRYIRQHDINVRPS